MIRNSLSRTALILAATLHLAACCRPALAQEEPPSPEATASDLAAQVLRKAGDGDLGDWTRSIVERALKRAGEAARQSAGQIEPAQYACGDYRKLLRLHGIKASMSRKGNCLDNAPMESFFGSLKTELVHRTRFSTRREARAALFEYIEIFYNQRRRHSSIGYRAIRTSGIVSDSGRTLT